MSSDVDDFAEDTSDEEVSGDKGLETNAVSTGEIQDGVAPKVSTGREKPTNVKENEAKRPQVPKKRGRTKKKSESQKGKKKRT